VDRGKGRNHPGFAPLNAGLRIPPGYVYRRAT
jgi:hypothetical protein